VLTPNAKHIRRTTWAIISLETGAVLFVAGLLVLYFNPFWHFDAGGFLDWRVHWCNAAGEILIASGLLIEALALLGSAAVLVSRCVNQRLWPYGAAAVLLCWAVASLSLSGLTRELDAHFEWDAADGFSVFRLQGLDDGRMWRWAVSPIWQSIVEIQIQPSLRGYFKVNDWRKMNGDIGVKVVRILPIAWPIALGNGGETLDDPDETALMRAAALEDLKTVQQLLSASARADVNSLDQGGQTALILACRNAKPSPDVIKALIAAGADVNLRSRNGYTALTWARARNNSECVRILRRSGGKP
jgi:ankyrin repeat protein